MMEKLRKALTSATALFMVAVIAMAMIPWSVLPAQAGLDEDVFMSGDWFYSIGEDGGAMVHGYSGSSAKITVPSKLGGKKVTAMGESIGYLEVTSITLPSSVKTVEGSAFTGAPKLSEIKVDSKNKYFTSASGVLFSKDKTELVAYPAGKTNTSYTIPSGVTKISATAFYGSDLVSVSIPDSVTEIGNAAFCLSMNLKSVAIPDGVKKIGFNTFGYCGSLESVVIPSSVTVIEDYAFSECSALKNVYFLGTSEEWAKVKIAGSNNALKEAEVVFAQAPGAVAGVKLDKATETTLKFSWSAAAGATGYKVVLYKGKTVVDTVYTTKLSYTFKKLKKGTSYKVKVYAYTSVYGGKAVSEDSADLSTSTKVAKASVSSVKSTKAKQAAVAWKSVTGASGYQVEYSTSKKFTKKTTKKVTVKSKKAKKTTLKKLKSGKKYYVRVRAYKTVNGKNVYGSWSSAKNLKIK